MKKSVKILALASLVLLVGCTSSAPAATPAPTAEATTAAPTAEATTTAPVGSADMSGYEFLEDPNHVYEPLTVTQLQEAMDQKESLVFYMGYPGCPWCQEVVPTLNKVAKEEGITVYYLSMDNQENTGEEAIDWLCQLLKDYMSTDENGGISLLVPDVVVIKDGVVVDCHTSTVDGHNAHERRMTTEEEAQLEEIFRAEIKEAQ